MIASPDAVVFGPGLAETDGYRDCSSAFCLTRARRPSSMAVALNLLARSDGWSGRPAPGLVLTPHPGEFARLTGARGSERPTSAALGAMRGCRPSASARSSCSRGANRRRGAGWAVGRLAVRQSPRSRPPAVATCSPGDRLAHGAGRRALRRGPARRLSARPRRRAAVERLGDAGRPRPPSIAARAAGNAARAGAALAAERSTSASRAAGLPPLPRGVWLEIDEAALTGNLRCRARARRARAWRSTRWSRPTPTGMASSRWPRVFEAAGADRLCVASLDEAFAAARRGRAASDPVLFPIPAAEVARAAQARFEIVAAEAYVDRGKTSRRGAPRRRAPEDVELKVHLEVETGLVARRFRSARGVELARLNDRRHAARDAGGPLVAPRQPGEYDRITRPRTTRSSAATAAIQRGRPARARRATCRRPAGCSPSARADCTKACGRACALYGLLPDDLPIGGARARRLRTAAAGDGAQVPAAAQSRRLPRARPSATAVAGRPTVNRVIATLPVGYGDGWCALTRPGAEALVRGRRVPLVGTVAMDAVDGRRDRRAGRRARRRVRPDRERRGRIVTQTNWRDAAPPFRGKSSLPWHTGYPGCTMPARYFWAFGHWNGEARINDVGLVGRGF